MIINSIRVSWVADKTVRQDGYSLTNDFGAPMGELSAEVHLKFADNDGANLYLRMDQAERREFFDMVNRWVHKRTHTEVLNASYVVNTKNA